MTGKIEGSNKATIAILLVLKEVIKDFEPKKGQHIFNQQLLNLIRDEITPFLKECTRIMDGQEYALNYIRG